MQSLEKISLVISVAALVVAAAALLQISAVGEKIERVSAQLAGLEQVVAQLGRGEELRGIEARLEKMEKELSGLRDAAEELARLWRAPSGDVAVRYARLFELKYDGKYYIARDALGRTILLAPRGAGDVKLYVEKYRPDVVVEYPVRRAVYMSSTQVGLLYRLYLETGDVSLLRSISGIMWGRQYQWHLEEIAAMLSNGTIVDVGPASSPDYETLLKLRPDVVFVYFYAGPFGTEAVIERLKTLNVPFVVINEFQEASPLGRFEWIKFVAAFYNKTGEAAAIFNKVESRWNSLSALAADLDRPRVAWFIIFGGVLYPAGGTARELIRLAGGRYAYANYSRVDMEVVLKHRNDVDVLIWSGYGVKSVEDLARVDRRLLELRPVIAGRAYAFSEAYWQLSHVYPERLLEELIWIIHPEVAPPGEFKLFVPLR